MHFPVEGTWKTLLFFTVLTSWAIGLSETVGDKTLNLRIGFDLTQGKNGAPALRIRDFEESAETDRYPRAVDEDEEKKSKPAIRADSFSESVEENEGKGHEKDESSREANTDESDDSDAREPGLFKRHKSTKGLHAEEYEPEDNPSIHGRGTDEEASDTEERRHRRKRHAEYVPKKTKSKKFRSGRKQGVTSA